MDAGAEKDKTESLEERLQQDEDQLNS